MLLEIVWTLVPAFILMFIAIPSFALLYSTSTYCSPELSLKCIGHQWYWSYEISDAIVNLKELFKEKRFDFYTIC